MDTRYYIIFSTSELDKINFSEVMESSVETLRRSVDGSKTFVKYTGEMPASVASLTTKQSPLTYEEILAELGKTEWIHPLTN
jgi:hypothetical protein